MSKTPKLRFKEFSGDWESKKVASVFDRVSNKVDVIEDEYYEQIGIRSHGKGIFYKEPVSGKELGSKRVFWVEPNVFIVNIVFAWEQAVARTTKNEVGMIASHRFPMYKPKEHILDLNYITQLFKTPRGKFLLGLASPGGAGRNKTLGQKEFDDLEIVLPSYEEQKKISTLISLIDKKIIKQSDKVDALKEYKKGMMKKIFSRELRFKDDEGRDYPEWKDKKFEDVIKFEIKSKYPASFKKSNGDFRFVLSNTSDEKWYCDEYILDGESIIINDGGEAHFKYMSGKHAYSDHCIAVSTKECTQYIYYYLDFNKSTIDKIGFVGSGIRNIDRQYLKKFKVSLPTIEEQEKIANVLSMINSKIEKDQEKLDSLNKYKKGLLQQMFV